MYNDLKLKVKLKSYSNKQFDILKYEYLCMSFEIIH